MGKRINSIVYVRVLSEHMKFFLSIIPTKEMGDHMRQTKIFLTLGGIEPMTSRLIP